MENAAGGDTVCWLGTPTMVSTSGATALDAIWEATFPSTEENHITIRASGDGCAIWNHTGTEPANTTTPVEIFRINVPSDAHANSTLQFENLCVAEYRDGSPGGGTNIDVVGITVKGKSPVRARSRGSRVRLRSTGDLFPMLGVTDGRASSAFTYNVPKTPMQFVNSTPYGYRVDQGNTTAVTTGFFDENIDADPSLVRGEQALFDEFSGHLTIFDDVSENAIITWDIENYEAVQTITITQLRAYLESIGYSAADAGERDDEPELGCIADPYTMYVINNVNTPSDCDDPLVNGPGGADNEAGIYRFTRESPAADWEFDDYQDLPQGTCEDAGSPGGDDFVFRYNGMFCPDGKIHILTGGGGSGGADYDNGAGQDIEAGIYEYDYEANDLVREPGGDIGPKLYTFPEQPGGGGNKWPGIFRMSYHHGSGLAYSVGLQTSGGDKTYLVEIDWTNPDGPTNIGLWDLSPLHEGAPDTTFGLGDIRSFTVDPITGRAWTCHNVSVSTNTQCPGMRTLPRPWLVNGNFRE